MTMLTLGKFDSNLQAITNFQNQLKMAEYKNLPINLYDKKIGEFTIINFYFTILN